MQIAVNAGERQIVEFIQAVVKAWNDVLNVERRQRRILLMQLAVFAPLAGAFPDRGSRRGIHRSGNRRNHLPRLTAQDGDKFVRAHVAFVFGSLGFGQRAFGGLGSE